MDKRLMTGCVCTVVLGLASQTLALAQEKDAGKAAPQEPAAASQTPPAPGTAPPASPPGGAAAEFQRLFEDWKTVLKDLRQLKVRYQSAALAEQAQIQQQWNDLIAKGNELIDALQEAGLKAYAEAPNEDPQLMRFLVKLADDRIDHDDYLRARQITSVLLEHHCPEKQIYNAAAIAAYVLNDYDEAEKYFKLAKEAGVLSDYGKELEPTVAEYKELWAKEKAIREAEAKADDLPRVKLSTTKGDIVLELFENEAPETVGNFISLVEQGFYNGLTFHRVLKNFMAQGGDPKGDGSGGPGYHIYCECYRPDYRRHFQGSLSMAHAGRDTGGSQFFLTFRPTPHLNGKHTCFGRVIEGMEVLSKLQRRDPTASNPPAPDSIIKAEVLRKRDHAYQPHKVP
jgi:cyclophilin family peptidyl-prolyl cis-trans isomerase/TolA-binding protein